VSKLRLYVESRDTSNSTRTLTFCLSNEAGNLDLGVPFTTQLQSLNRIGVASFFNSQRSDLNKSYFYPGPGSEDRMKVSRFARFAFLLSVACLLLHKEKLVAAPGSVPTGECLFPLDTTAANSFQNAGAHSVYPACGVVSESSSSGAFRMEGSETLYLENHAQVSVVGGALLRGQTCVYNIISAKDVRAAQVTGPGDPLASILPLTSGTVFSKSPAYFDTHAKSSRHMHSSSALGDGAMILTADWEPYDDDFRICIDSSLQLPESRIA
jgi:hypothetical protein